MPCCSRSCSSAAQHAMHARLQAALKRASDQFHRPLLRWHCSPCCILSSTADACAAGAAPLLCWCASQKKYSVCHVEAAELFEKGVAKAGGLSDPRMGTMDKFGGICTTDGANMHDCPGYFGHIELAQPVYHCKLTGISSLGVRYTAAGHVAACYAFTATRSIGSMQAMMGVAPKLQSTFQCAQSTRQICHA